MLWPQCRSQVVTGNARGWISSNIMMVHPTQSSTHPQCGFTSISSWSKLIKCNVIPRAKQRCSIATSPRSEIYRLVDKSPEVPRQSGQGVAWGTVLVNHGLQWRQMLRTCIEHGTLVVPAECWRCEQYREVYLDAGEAVHAVKFQ